MRMPLPQNKLVAVTLLGGILAAGASVALAAPGLLQRADVSPQPEIAELQAFWHDDDDGYEDDDEDEYEEHARARAAEYARHAEDEADER